MRTTLKLMLVLLAALALLSFAACSDDDDDNGDNGGTNPTVPDPWVGVWLSAGDNVAPILQGDPFNLDSVRVHMDENNVVVLEQHVEGGAWTSLTGTYSVTESASGDIHSIQIVYPAFEQEGIIQVTEGTPDTMLLEAVQTVPDFGFVPRTPETGFGSDPLYGDTNIQTYVRVE
jgi:hypothetical protein